VTVTVVELDRTLRFCISDEGLGVPPGERRRIFEKFYRLDPDMNRGIGGTGLGLYICRELVRRLGGRIWVEPNTGAGNGGTGSSFNVELPIATAATEPKRPREPAASTRPG
jgi:signal transduction histidine kinase